MLTVMNRMVNGISEYIKAYATVQQSDSPFCSSLLLRNQVEGNGSSNWAHFYIVSLPANKIYCIG